MKKAISIIILFVLCLVLLSACNVEKEATVVIDGKTQTVTSSEICDYSAKYEGADITVTDKVQRINGPYFITDGYWEYWLDLRGYVVKVDSKNSAMKSLNVGDTITAEGTIEHAYVNVDIRGTYIDIVGK